MTPAGPGVPQAPGAFLMINSFETGGTERQFVGLAKALSSSGAFRVDLGCLQRTGPLMSEVGDVSWFRLRGSLYGWQSIKSRLRLAGHLCRHRVRIAHAFDFYSNLTLIPAARLARTPVVIGSHRQLGDLLTPAQFRVQLAVFRWCDVVVCNSRAAAERLAEHGFPESKLAVIGNGLAQEAFAAAAPALPRDEGLLRIGMIARMNARYKNHAGLLRAVAQLRTEFPRLDVLLAGDGPLRPELENLARELGIADCARFLGDCRNIPVVLASVDVSVVPSESESLSNVVIESMAASVPVVATDVGGNKELLSDGRGLLVPPADDAALAEAMARLLRDSALRATLADRARRYAKERFSMDRIAYEYEELYSDLLERKGRNTTRSGARTRVAMVAPTLRWVGGQAVQADLLLRYWKDDPEVEARFIPVDPEFPRGLRWLERVPVVRTLLREPLYLRSLWRGLKDADIAHIFSASYWSFLLAPAPAWLIARLRGTRTLINYRSGEARDHLRRSLVAVSVLAKTDKLVVPSGYLVDVFREFGLAAHAVPNLVDLSQFQFRARAPLRPHLVCTRGFHPYYCVDVVVEAFAQVQSDFPDARLDLVGGGPEEGRIREMVAKLRLSGVTFTGVAPRHEIGRYYDEADIFINASRLDNMPVSVLEAFRAGTPVVTTAPEGMRYLVEHERTGLLSPPGDARALAENVKRLLRDPELSLRLARNAYEESRRYSWEAVRGQWLQVYESLTLSEQRLMQPSLEESKAHQ